MRGIEEERAPQVRDAERSEYRQVERRCRQDREAKLVRREPHLFAAHTEPPKSAQIPTSTQEEKSCLSPFVHPAEEPGCECDGWMGPPVMTNVERESDIANVRVEDVRGVGGREAPA